MRKRAAGGALPPIHAVSQRLLDTLAVDVAAASPSVLELGCGSGALTVELLQRGASSALGVDLSTESLDVARRRGTAAGVESRVRFEIGDAAWIPLNPHDWVVLDRVLCCYADLDRLLGNSVDAAQQRYAFSVPVSTGWRGVANRVWFWLEDATEALRGRPCPGYVHDVARIEARLVAAGFHRVKSSVVAGLWYVAVFDRG
jgi:SAM-dependent methyltransferase